MNETKKFWNETEIQNNILPAISYESQQAKLTACYYPSTNCSSNSSVGSLGPLKCSFIKIEFRWTEHENILIFLVSQQSSKISNKNTNLFQP